MGDGRKPTREELALLKRDGKLKCPWGCGNFMQDFRMNTAAGRPMRNPEMYCPHCHASLSLSSR